MAIFSTRSSKRGEDQAPTKNVPKNVPIDSIETLRTRARQRLIGAVVLVALGIVAFTLLFDSQPRPIPVDIQITMPDKDKSDAMVSSTMTAPAAPATAAPLSPATPPAPTTSQIATPAVPAAAAAAAAAVQASASLSAKEEIVGPKADKKPEAKPEVKPEVKANTKPAPKPDVKPAPKPAANDEAAKAMAILEGKTPPKSETKPETKTEIKPETKTESASASAPVSAADAAAGRFVVQVGAFVENDKARDTRLKVERAGLKTYVHVAETPNGKRIRVRVGPFATRVEAEKAAAKIKTLNLPAAILTL